MGAPGTTPGPWSVHESRSHIHEGTWWSEILGPTGEVIGEVYHDDEGRSPIDAEARANAHLTAASPCLYDAGERLLNAIIAEQEWDSSDTTSRFDAMLYELADAKDAMRAALAKARGETVA